MGPKRLIAIFIIFFNLFCFVRYSQVAEGKNNQYSEINENIFSFEIPAFWSRMEGEELVIFRKQYEDQSKQLYEQYHGQHQGYDSGVPFICGFFAPRMEATFAALVMNIPSQAEDYLDEIYIRHLRP